MRNIFLDKADSFFSRRYSETLSVINYVLSIDIHIFKNIIITIINIYTELL